MSTSPIPAAFTPTAWRYRCHQIELHCAGDRFIVRNSLGRLVLITFSADDAKDFIDSHRDSLLNRKPKE